MVYNWAIEAAGQAALGPRIYHMVQLLSPCTLCPAQPPCRKTLKSAQTDNYQTPQEICLALMVPTQCCLKLFWALKDHPKDPEL